MTVGGRRPSERRCGMRSSPKVKSFFRLGHEAATAAKKEEYSANANAKLVAFFTLVQYSITGNPRPSRSNSDALIDHDEASPTSCVIITKGVASQASEGSDDDSVLAKLALANLPTLPVTWRDAT